MSNPTSSLSEKDIPFLLEQLEFQSNSLAEAEQTITKFQNAGSGKTQAMTADEKDEADLEIETLQDRVTMTEEGLTFFFREYARLKRILHKHNITDSEHALIRAAEHNRIHIVGLLLEADTDVNVRDQTGGTALIAACYNGYTEVALELLHYKANPDLQDEGGHTALIFSCDKGHVEICTSLVDAGAALNMQDNRGNSGLLMAAYIGHIDVCHLLVERGVQVNIQNDDGRTPLMMACYPPEVETRYLNAKCDICALLIGAGADVNVVNASKNTALHIASKYSHFEECEILLNAGGADTTVRNSDGMLAVDVAGDARTKMLLQKKKNSGSGSGSVAEEQYPPLPSNVKISSPKRVESEKTMAKRSSITMIKSVFKVGGKSKQKEKEVVTDDDLVVDDMHNLYGASDRVNDRRHKGKTSSGDTEQQRQRYAFVHENALATRDAIHSPAEKRKEQLKLGKLSKNNVNASASASANANSKLANRIMSVGERNALNFSSMTNRNSLEERASTGNIAGTSRDSMTEARERRRRQSSGASGDMARQLEDLRRRAAAGSGSGSHGSAR